MQNQETFKSIVLKEAHHAFLYTSSSMITQLGSFLLLPLFWRKLSVADYGVIGVSEILCSFFGIFWGLSLEVSVSRFYYEWPEEERAKRLGSLWILSWASSIILGLLTIWLLSLTHRFLFPDVPFFPYVLLGILHGIFVRMRLFTFSTIRIKQLPAMYFRYSLSIFIASLLSNLIFVWYLDWGLLGYFIAWNMSELAILIACFFLMRKFASITLVIKDIRECVRFALPLIPNSAINSLSTISDRYLLQRFASLEALGIYTVCLRFTNIINVVHEALKMSFAPFAFKAVSEEGPEAAPKIARIRIFYLLPIFAIALAIGFYIKDFVRLINEPSYFPVAQYVPLLIGAPVIISLFAYFASGILFSKKSEVLWIPAFVQMVTVLVGGVLLIPKYQMNGIIVNRYINSILFVVVGAVLSQKYFPIPFKGRKLALLFSLFGLGIVVAAANSIQSLPLSIFYSTAGLLLFVVVLTVIIAGPGYLMREIKQRFTPRVSMD